jgi:hypothetical protein
MEADEMSDLELLASATQEAMDAYRAGVIIGHVPTLDVLALRCAVRRALGQGEAQPRRTPVAGGVA